MKNMGQSESNRCLKYLSFTRKKAIKLKSLKSLKNQNEPVGSSKSNLIAFSNAILCMSLVLKMLSLGCQYN